MVVMVGRTTNTTIEINSILELDTAVSLVAHRLWTTALWRDLSLSPLLHHLLSQDSDSALLLRPMDKIHIAECTLYRTYVRNRRRDMAPEAEQVLCHEELYKKWFLAA